MIKKLKVISDGTIPGTMVIDEDGDQLLVQRIAWEIDLTQPYGRLTVTVTGLNFMEIEQEGVIVDGDES